MAHELILTRLMDVPADKLFRCWTEPSLMKQWFAPKPYTTPVAEVDLRPGGASNVVMKSPEGQEIRCPAVSGNRAGPQDRCHRCLCRRLAAGRKTFMTTILTFEPEGSKTRYTARVLHWSEDDKKKHEEMGFHQGWGQCADQLEALAKSL